uniref:Uncharacterized protein n=1 Tax=Mucochytrium quahogii TaxID=96639 RepID=A0A7S2SM48_9STRA|mmetsp:Transcript_18420/g.29970  ORF Transcript_18420/g.29970 Transcript_18420/m.29970 type:complete len:343 (+) Transcript_18420:31-1059(+)
MNQFNAFTSQHDDFVHDIEYDTYGKRLATCSSDHKIKIWSENAAGEWQCDAELEGHRGAVWKLAWAHPEFGQVLASCSFDQRIIIWEEMDTPVSTDENSNMININGVEQPIPGNNASVKKQANNMDVLSRWHQVSSLKGDGRESVNDMKFAPRHFGLCLATCSTDGFVRIFDADDVMNLENWTMSKFEATSDKEEATSLSWNQSRFDSQMMVVGSTSHIKVWTKNQTERRWEVLADLSVGDVGIVNDVCWAPNLGRSYHLIAAAAANSEDIQIFKLMTDPETNSYRNFEMEAKLSCNTEVWRCEWNLTGTVLAASGEDGTIRLWRKNFKNVWDQITEESLCR